MHAAVCQAPDNWAQARGKGEEDRGEWMGHEGTTEQRDNQWTLAIKNT
jgi:hypothetical protein